MFYIRLETRSLNQSLLPQMLAVMVQICTPNPRVPGISASDAISHQATEISSSRPQPNGAVSNLELRIKQQKDCCVVRGEEVGNAPSDLGGREDLGKPGPAHKVSLRKGWCMSHERDPLYNSLRR